MLKARFDSIQRILCLGAHSDDIEIGCGGSLLELLSRHEGVHVDWVVLSGSEERAREARAGAEAILGAAASSHVRVEGFRDSFFPQEEGELKEFLHRLDDRLQPDLIFTHHCRDFHQDHRTLAKLTYSVFRNHTIFEYEIPKYDGDLGRPNVYIAISEERVNQKLHLIETCFPSQNEKEWFEAETFRSVMRLRGVECKAPGRYAEAFHVPRLLI